MEPFAALLKKPLHAIAVIAGWFAPGLILVEWNHPGAALTMDLGRLGLLLTLAPSPAWFALHFASAINRNQKKDQGTKESPEVESEAVWLNAAAIFIIALTQRIMGDYIDGQLALHLWALLVCGSCFVVLRR